MKTHPFPMPTPHSSRYRGQHLRHVTDFATVHGRAACGSGPVTITNAPNLGGSMHTVTALNAAGQITGYSLLPGDEERHAFRFGAGGLLDLGTLGGNRSYGFVLNDRDKSGRIRAGR